MGLTHSPVGAVAVASILPDVAAVSEWCVEHLDLGEEAVQGLFQHADTAATDLSTLFGVDMPPPLYQDPENSPQPE